MRVASQLVRTTRSRNKSQRPNPPNVCVCLSECVLVRGKWVRERSLKQHALSSVLAVSCERERKENEKNVKTELKKEHGEHKILLPHQFLPACVFKKVTQQNRSINITG